MEIITTNESLCIMKNYIDLCSKIADLSRSITKNSDHYVEKYMKFNLVRMMIYLQIEARNL